MLTSKQIAIISWIIPAVWCGVSGSSFAASSPPDLCGAPSPLSQFAKEIFCAAAADLGENPALAVGQDAVVYRLAALPSFKHPFVLTIRVGSDGTAELTVRRRDTSHSLVHLDATLSLEELGEVRAEMASAKFSTLPIIADYSLNPDDRAEAKKRGEVVVCGDGTVWILEAWSNESYHVSYAGCAPYKQFDTLVTQIAELGRRSFPQAQIDWDR